MKPDREAVIARAREVFPSHDADEIMSILDRYGTEKYENERERVQLDILKLSKGDLDRLEKFVQVAKRDYRDVITWAEYTKP